VRLQLIGDDPGVILAKPTLASVPFYRIQIVTKLLGMTHPVSGRALVLSASTTVSGVAISLACIIQS
jgi:hypothetical protein